MKRKIFGQALTGIGLAVLLYGWGCIEVSQIVDGSTQGKKDPTVALPKARNPNATTGLDSRSFIVSMPAEGEFYVGGQRVTREVLAVTTRDAFVDKPVDEQRIYVRCSAPLKFGAVRQLLNVLRQVGFDRIEFVVESAGSRREAVLEAMIFVAFDFKPDPADQITLPPPRPRPSANRPPPPPPPPPPPRRRQKPVPIEPLGGEALVVEVKSEGGGPDQVVALNTRIMPLSNLRTLLSNLLEIRPEKHIFIKPSRNISYGDVIAVMDEIKGAGANPLLLLIDEVEVPRKIPNTGRPPALQSDALPGGGGVAGGVVGGVPGAEPDELPRILRKSGVALQESATRRVEPATPRRAKAAKVTGAVVVEVIIDEHGDVVSARVISGHPLLKDAAVDAARGWKFTPTQFSGEPIKVISTLTFIFK